MNSRLPKALFVAAMPRCGMSAVPTRTAQALAEPIGPADKQFCKSKCFNAIRDE